MAHLPTEHPLGIAPKDAQAAAPVHANDEPDVPAHGAPETAQGAAAEAQATALRAELEMVRAERDALREELRRRHEITARFMAALERRQRQAREQEADPGSEHDPGSEDPPGSERPRLH